MASANFTKTVKKVAGQVLPAYVLQEAVGGAAPSLCYLRPVSAERPLFEEAVWVAKLRWGSDDFDLGVELRYRGPAVGGQPLAYVVATDEDMRQRLPIDSALAETLSRELMKYSN